MVHPTLRRCLFWAHLATGVVAGLVILILAVTGILMSFETQIIGKSERGIVTDKAAVTGNPAGPEKLIGAYQSAGLEGRPTALVLSSDPGDPAVFQMGREGRQLLHPESGEALGKGAEKTRRFFQIVVSIHRWITWPAQRAEGQGQAQGQRGGAVGQGGEGRGEGGQSKSLTWRDVGGQITAGGTLVFGFLLVSGLVLWVPRKFSKKAFKAVTLPQSRLKGRARDWNWHNIAGFWAAPFILLIVLTGMIMAYPWANTLLFKSVGETPPPRRASGGGEGGMQGGQSVGGARAEGRERRAPRAEGAEGGEPRGERGGRREGRGMGAEGPMVTKNLDAAFGVAKQAVPGWETISLELGADETKPVMVTVSDAGRGRPDRKLKLTIDRGTLEITGREGFDKTAATTGAKMRQFVRWIHTGEAGGIGGQIVALVVCLLTVVLIYTGFALAWRRLVGWRKKRA